MVFSSAAMMSVADVSADTWQRMRSSEFSNTQQLCWFPFGHLVLCLWEFLCLPRSDSYDDAFSFSSSSDDEADDEDMLAFNHNRYANDYAADDGAES
uniref:Uncharacterized protein n=1 Tax=Noccaea caerulescens TaxID=107243 RepID=A0A1J3J341_NOCCA